MRINIEGAGKHIEFSGFAYTVNVDLEAWGAPPGTRVTVRASNRSAQLMACAFPKAMEPSTAAALKAVTDRLGSLGLRRIWLGMPFRNEQIQKNFETAGFIHRGTYQRLALSLADWEKAAPSEAIKIVPLDLKAEEFAEFFHESRSGSPGIETNLDAEMAVGVLLHEQVTGQIDLFRTIRKAGVAIGSLGIVIIQNGKIAIFQPHLRRQAWEEKAGALEALSAMLREFKASGVETVQAGAESTQLDHLAIYDELGFKKSSEYIHLMKQLT